MILSHLADEALAACPTTPAGFLFWVFTPPGGDTWVEALHAVTGGGGGYAPDLLRHGGAGWAEDTGGWPTGSTGITPWISSNTNGWLVSGATSYDYWQRTAGGWSLITSVDNSGALIGSASVYTTGPGAGATWGVFTRRVTGLPTVELATWDGSSLVFSPYSERPTGLGVIQAYIRGTAGNLWLLLQVDRNVGSGYMTTWFRQLAGSTPGAAYTEPADAYVDSGCNELYPCPDGSLWGAGWQWQNDGDTRHAAFWRHDGSTGWTVQAAPVPATEATSQLYGVHGVAADDVWAVGYWTDTSNTSRVLIEHYDGTAWSIVTPSPAYSNAAGGIDPYLVAVQMRAADDGWAVGAACSQWLSYHWNGSAWVESPITGV